MKKALLFLNGSYKKKHLDYYQTKIRNSYTVAVDGGYQFFQKTKNIPHLLLGDFDSIKHPDKVLSDKTEVVTYPIDKNKTDMELALEFVMTRGYKNVSIAQPDVGDVDHFLGNLFLVMKYSILKQIKSGLKLSFIHPEYSLTTLSDNRLSFVKAKDDVVSVFSLSNAITLSNSGFEYKANELRIDKGSSCGLRNVISSNRAFLEVVGQALIYQKYSQIRQR